MEKKTEASLLKLAKDTAKSIRKRTAIPGWREDFRQCSFNHDMLGDG